MLRYLRIVASIVSAMLSIVIVVFWARSYVSCDSIYGPPKNGQQALIVSSQGEIYFGVWPNVAPPWKWHVTHDSNTRPSEGFSDSLDFLGIGIAEQGFARGFYMPHWFALLIV